MSIFQNSENLHHKRWYPRSVKEWKNKLRGLFDPVRLGQVNNSNKKFNNWTPGVPNPFVSLFWMKIWKNNFWKNNLVSQNLFEIWLQNTVTTKNLNYKLIEKSLKTIVAVYDHYIHSVCCPDLQVTT
jgi:hypothetical protein